MKQANPLSEIGRAAAEAAARATRISMTSAERTMHVQMEYAKGAIKQATINAHAASQAKDVQELMALRARIAENALENLMGYSRSLYEVASEAQSELSKLAEERLAAYQNAVMDAVDQAAKSAPGTGDVAAAAVKSSMAAATAAFDSMNKAARQVASYADAGVKVAKAPKRK